LVRYGGIRLKDLSWQRESAASVECLRRFSAEHAIGRKNQAYYDAYTPQKLKDLAAALKAATSSAGIGATRYGESPVDRPPRLTF
jgi:hypothetical protein